MTFWTGVIIGAFGMYGFLALMAWFVRWYDRHPA